MLSAFLFNFTSKGKKDFFPEMHLNLIFLTHVYTFIKTIKKLSIFKEFSVNSTEAGSMPTGCVFPLFPLFKTKGCSLQ